VSDWRQGLRRVLRGAGLDDGPAPPASTQELVEIRTALRGIADRLDAGQHIPHLDILDAYCTDLPSPQTAVDIFAGEWASRLPAPLQHVQAGSAPLFEIEHVPWGVKALGGVEGQRVVELGPLEGGHTYLLDRMGAAEVVAVEANTRAYLKCLIAKELFDITSARFRCGDALRFLEDEILRGATKFRLLPGEWGAVPLQQPGRCHRPHDAQQRPPSPMDDVLRRSAHPLSTRPVDQVPFSYAHGLRGLRAHPLPPGIPAGARLQGVLRRFSG